MKGRFNFFFHFIGPIKLYIESENQYVTSAERKHKKSMAKICYSIDLHCKDNEYKETKS